MDEQVLIEAARGGDVAAFNRLVLLYQSAMFNVACHILGDGDAAADATQDAVLSAFRAIGTFRNGSLRSWLLRITTNQCYDDLRKRRCRRTCSIDDPTIDPDRLALMADMGELAGEHLDRQQLAQVLRSAILSLPPQQRAVVVLADIQGLDYQEIAAVLGIAYGTVKSRLSRARAALRDMLQENRELLPQQYRYALQHRAATSPRPDLTPATPSSWPAINTHAYSY